MMSKFFQCSEIVFLDFHIFKGIKKIDYLYFRLLIFLLVTQHETKNEEDENEDETQ